MFYFQQFAQKVQFPVVKFFSQTIQPSDELTDRQNDKANCSRSLMELKNASKNIFSSSFIPSPPFMWFSQVNWTLLFALYWWFKELRFFDIFFYVRTDRQTDRTTNKPSTWSSLPELKDSFRWQDPSKVILSM